MIRFAKTFSFYCLAMTIAALSATALTGCDANQTRSGSVDLGATADLGNGMTMNCVGTSCTVYSRGVPLYATQRDRETPISANPMAKKAPGFQLEK